MLKRVLSVMIALSMLLSVLGVTASEEVISNVVIGGTIEAGKNLEVTYDLAEDVPEQDVTVNWYIASPGDDMYFDTGITGTTFPAEYVHSGMNIKAKVSTGDVSVWSDAVTESLTALVSADDKFDSDIVISSTDGYTIDSGSVSRDADENVLKFATSATKAKATRNFPAITGPFAFSMKLKHDAVISTSTVIGGAGGVATIITYANKTIQISVLNDAGNGATTYNAGAGYTIGEWHLISGVFDTDTDTFSMYIDGKKIFDRKGFRAVSNGVPVNISNISYAYTELGANAAGNAYLDNISVRKVHPLPVCDAPVATNVVVNGSNRIGSVLTAAYDYAGEYREMNSDISWYASAEEGGTYTKLAATGSTLAVTDGLAGLYIKASVTPSDAWGTTGETVYSQPAMSKNLRTIHLSDSFDVLPETNFKTSSVTETNTVTAEDGTLKIVFTDGAPIVTYSASKPFTGKSYVDFMVKNDKGQAWLRVKGSKGDGIILAIDAATNLKVNNTAVTKLALGEWHRVKLVFTPVGNNTDPAIDVYVNGEKVAEGYTLSTGIENVTSFAAAKTTAGSMWIDELAMYNIDENGGTLDSGVNWKYAADTKTITFSGNGAIPDYSTIVAATDPTFYTNRDWNSIVGQVENFVAEEGITSIGSNAFRGASKLKTVKLPSTCESINAYAFTRSAVESLTLSEGLKTIGDGAFTHISALKEVTIPASVETIHFYAFGGDTHLETIYTYKASAGKKFAKDNGIYSVLLDVVNTVKYDAATKTASIYAPESVEKVTVLFASYDDTGLKNVKFKDNVALAQGINPVSIEEFNAAEGEKTVVYVWSDMSNLTPVAESFEQ